MSESNKARWPRPWRDWNGNYQKIEYDVMLHDNRVIQGCWPNAGKMNDTLGTGQSWNPGQVKMIRRAKWPLLDTPDAVAGMSVAEICDAKRAEPTHEF